MKGKEPSAIYLGSTHLIPAKLYQKSQGLSCKLSVWIMLGTRWAS